MIGFLGIPEKDRPKARMLGKCSELENYLKIAKEALEEEGFYDDAELMEDRVKKSKSYNESVDIILEYVLPV